MQNFKEIVVEIFEPKSGKSSVKVVNYKQKNKEHSIYF